MCSYLLEMLSVFWFLPVIKHCFSFAFWGNVEDAFLYLCQHVRIYAGGLGLKCLSGKGKGILILWTNHAGVLLPYPCLNYRGSTEYVWTAAFCHKNNWNKANMKCLKRFSQMPGLAWRLCVSQNLRAFFLLASLYAVLFVWWWVLK